MAALIRIAPHLRAVLAAHVSLKFVDRRVLRSPNDIKRDGLMGVAAEAPDLKIEVTRVERVTQGRGGLCRSPLRKHVLGPGFACQLVSFPARFRRALGRYADGGAVKSVS